jgi:hypothetical protein
MVVRWTWREVGLGYLLIAWIGAACYLINVAEPQMKMWLEYEEELAGEMKEPVEFEILRTKLEGYEAEMEELQGDLRKVRCQINMVMAASRSGWRKAERLMRTGAFISTCGTDEYNDRVAIAVVTDE